MTKYHQPKGENRKPIDPKKEKQRAENLEAKFTRDQLAAEKRLQRKTTKSKSPKPTVKASFDIKKEREKANRKEANIKKKLEDAARQAEENKKKLLELKERRRLNREPYYSPSPISKKASPYSTPIIPRSNRSPKTNSATGASSNYKRNRVADITPKRLFADSVVLSTKVPTPGMSSEGRYKLIRFLRSNIAEIISGENPLGYGYVGKATNVGNGKFSFEHDDSGSDFCLSIAKNLVSKEQTALLKFVDYEDGSCDLLISTKGENQEHYPDLKPIKDNNLIFFAGNFGNIRKQLIEKIRKEAQGVVNIGDELQIIKDEEGNVLKILMGDKSIVFEESDAHYLNRDGTKGIKPGLKFLKKFYDKFSDLLERGVEDNSSQNSLIQNEEENQGLDSEHLSKEEDSKSSQNSPIQNGEDLTSVTRSTTSNPPIITSNLPIITYKKVTTVETQTIPKERIKSKPYELLSETSGVQRRITPEDLTMFYEPGKRDQYYRAKFTKIAFDESKLKQITNAQGKKINAGIFNDSIIFMADFAGCTFEKVNFSQIDRDILNTVSFYNCKFSDNCIFPKGFKFKDSSIRGGTKEAFGQVLKAKTTLFENPIKPGNSVEEAKAERVFASLAMERLRNP